MSSHIRAFIAIELPGEVKSALAGTQDSLRGKGDSKEAKWVRADAMHLTITFLGNTDPHLVDSVIAALEAAVQVTNEFTLTTGAVGVRNKRIVWVEIKESAGLKALKESIDLALTPLGFKREAREFRPHLTLARVRSTTEARRLAGLIRDFEFEKLSFSPSSVTLFKSDLTSVGAHYTILKKIELKVN
ncbi:MAG: RNA 2',3'-cyclic phosphodiesterase [Thermodesulfobacteriota bacterium]